MPSKIMLLSFAISNPNDKSKPIAVIIVVSVSLSAVLCILFEISVPSSSVGFKIKRTLLSLSVLIIYCEWVQQIIGASLAES